MATVTVWPKVGTLVPKEHGGYFTANETVERTRWVQRLIDRKDLFEYDPGTAPAYVPPIQAEAAFAGLLSSQLSGLQGQYLNQSVTTIGQASASDGLGKTYRWDPASTAAQAAGSVYGVGTAGRWLAASGASSTEVRINGVTATPRPAINWIGVTGADNPGANSTDLTAGGVSRLTVSSSGTHHDLDVTGVTHVEFTSSGAKALTGMSPSPLPVNVVNRSNSGDLALPNNTGSANANRFAHILSADLTVPPGSLAMCWYDYGAARWVAVVISGSAAAAAVTPATLGMTWYRPDADKVAIATGVSQLSPMNGATALTQSTGGFQPAYIASDAAFNNRPVLSFDGTDDRLVAGALLSLRPITIWWVGSWSNGGGVLCGQYFSTSFEFAAWNGTSISWQEGAGTPSAAHAGYPATFAITADSGTGIIFYKNGAQIGTGTRAIAASGAGTNFGLGADHLGAGAAVCKIADFAFKSGVMTPSEIASLSTSYTAGRYGF